MSAGTPRAGAGRRCGIVQNRQALARNGKARLNVEVVILVPLWSAERRHPMCRKVRVDLRLTAMRNRHGIEVAAISQVNVRGEGCPIAGVGPTPP